MEMKYELREDYYSYIEMMRHLGAGAKRYDSHNTITIVHGNKVITWWKPGKEHNEVRKETYQLAEKFAQLSGNYEAFQPEKMTPGRLIRAFLKHIIKLEITGKSKIYGDRYYYLVKERQQLLSEQCISEVDMRDTSYGFTALPLRENASHWHYLYLAEKPSGYAIELDIKAAYFTSLLQEKTLFWYDPGKGGGNCFWLPDGGAMLRLNEYVEEIPKWFRLQMLGIIGSHQREYGTLDLATGFIIPQVDNGAIKYGSAFNTVHKAIYRVYKVMSEVANQVGVDLLRSHTDCFTLKASMTRRAEAEFLSALAARGFTVSCKGVGWAHFWDIDRGLLGMGEPKGHLKEIDDLRQRDGVYVKYAPPEMWDRWSHWLPPVPRWMAHMGSEILDFVPSKKIPKCSPEKLQGYWRIWKDGQWISKIPESFPVPSPNSTQTDILA